MADYTKVNVQRYIIELIKIKAAADGRSVTNYIERLLLADVVGNDMVAPDKDVK